MGQLGHSTGKIAWHFNCSITRLGSNLDLWCPFARGTRSRTILTSETSRLTPVQSIHALHGYCRSLVDLDSPIAIAAAADTASSFLELTCCSLIFFYKIIINS